jgi:hypothetical protein
MARTPVETHNQDFLVTDVQMPGLATMADAVRYLDAQHIEASENALAVARQVGYDGTLTVGALEDEIRFYQRRSVEACIELGKRLLVLKELVMHGEFAQRAELLGIQPRMAQKFMAATLKFSNANSNTLLKAAGTQTKMLELLILDDGEIEALESGETVRGVTLDKIETMSVSELKKALRDANERIEAKDAVIKDKSEKIDRQAEKIALADSKKRSEPATMPEQRLLDLRSNLQISSAHIKASVMTDLRRHIMALYDHADQTGGSEIAFMANCIIEIGRELTILRDEYNFPDNLNDSPASDSVWAALNSDQPFEVPGAAEFAARMAAAKGTA